jgi:fermentation-respiration switch protein FrsA (DUF1100 family)
VLGALVTTGADFGGKQTVLPPAALLAQLADPDTDPITLLPLLFPPSARAAQDAYVKDVLMLPPEKISRETYIAQSRAYERWVDDERTYRGLTRVRISVLVTNGADDLGVPVENARRIYDRLVRAARRKLILFEGAAHGMMFQNGPELVNAIVRFTR